MLLSCPAYISNFFPYLHIDPASAAVETRCQLLERSKAHSWLDSLHKARFYRNLARYGAARQVMRCELMKLLTCQVEELSDDRVSNKKDSVDSLHTFSSVDMSLRSAATFAHRSFTGKSDVEGLLNLYLGSSRSMVQPLTPSIKVTSDNSAISVFSGAVSGQNLEAKAGDPSEATLDRAFPPPSDSQDGGKGALDDAALQKSSLWEGQSDVKTLSPSVESQSSLGGVVEKLGGINKSSSPGVALASSPAGDVEITAAPAHGDSQGSSTLPQPANFAPKQMSEAAELAASDVATPARGALDSGNVTVTADVVSVGDVQVNSNGAIPGGEEAKERPGGSC